MIAWQFSIFFCILKPIDRVRFQAKLEEIMNLKADRALVIDLVADEDAARSAAGVIGQSLPAIERGMMVI